MARLSVFLMGFIVATSFAYQQPLLSEKDDEELPPRRRELLVTTTFAFSALIFGLTAVDVGVTLGSAICTKNDKDCADTRRRLAVNEDHYTCDRLAAFVQTDEELSLLLQKIIFSPTADHSAEVYRGLDKIESYCEEQINLGDGRMTPCLLYVGVGKELSTEVFVSTWLTLLGDVTQHRLGCAMIVNSINKIIEDSVPGLTIVNNSEEVNGRDVLVLEDCSKLSEPVCNAMTEDYGACQWDNVAQECTSSEDRKTQAMVATSQIEKDFGLIVGSLTAAATATAHILAYICRSYQDVGLLTIV